MVSVRKREKVYEYRFETSSVDGQGNELLNLDFQQDKLH